MKEVIMKVRCVASKANAETSSVDVVDVGGVELALGDRVVEGDGPFVPDFGM